MHVVTNYPDGMFCWVDLMTTDPEGAKAFYSGLFGWTFDDQPTDIGTIYTMCQIDGKNVAGLSGMSPEMQQQGMPPLWSSYIKHRDADAAAKKVTEAGGTVLFPPMDVMETGRMTTFQDPTGATVGIWQPKAHIGAQLVNMPNTLVWNELQTRDPDRAKAFYQTVFDWEDSSDENGYVMFGENGRVHSGMITMDESWGDMPPSWAVYFMVDDVTKAAERAKELGGTLLAPPTPAEEMGKFSVVQDPQGGIFTIMEFSGPVDLPPGHEA
jgi:predicted enzyme related to lactoylglutathione lyase